MKKWEKVFHASGDQKKAVVGILISDKRGFKPNMVTRNHCCIKGVSSSRGYDICKYYASSIRAPKCRKQILTNPKEEAYNNAVTMMLLLFSH